jgi:hypothetical protein
MKVKFLKINKSSELLPVGVYKATNKWLVVGWTDGSNPYWEAWEFVFEKDCPKMAVKFATNPDVLSFFNKLDIFSSFEKYFERLVINWYHNVDMTCISRYVNREFKLRKIMYKFKVNWELPFHTRTYNPYDYDWKIINKWEDFD